MQRSFVTRGILLDTIGRVGGSRAGGRGAASNVKFAGGDFDIDARATGPIIDKKFEGHSDLQQAAEKIKKAAH